MYRPHHILLYEKLFTPRNSKTELTFCGFKAFLKHLHFRLFSSVYKFTCLSSNAPQSVPKIQIKYVSNYIDRNLGSNIGRVLMPPKTCGCTKSRPNVTAMRRKRLVTGNKADEGGPPRASKTPKESDSVIVDEEASQSNLPPVPVLLKNNKYLARYPVPQDKRPWNVPLEGYAPIMFSAPELFTISRHNEESEKKLIKRVVEDGGYELKMCYYPPIWADPELYGMTQEDRQKYFQFNKAASIRYHPHHGPEKSVDINRVSYLGDYELHPITGAPLNPNGRTGMIGRGLLGKYGPNHAADPIVTCLSEDKNVLQLALIKRQDTGQFALPGGMVDPGEHDLSGTAVREFCEEALEGNDQSKLSADERKERRAEMVKRFVQHKKVDAPIISKVVNDPRNTDNAWMETQAFWFHFPSQDDLGRKLQAGDDAVGAAWVTLDESFDINILYADHPEIVIELFRVIKDWPGISEEFEGLVVPDSIKRKL